MKYLIEEYRLTLRIVERAIRNPENYHDYSKLSSASSDLRYSIEFMETGIRPGNRRGAHRLAGDKREIPMDPQDYKFLKLAVSRGKVENQLSQHQKELLDDLLDILTSREKEAFQLVRGQGYSFSEAGQVLGVSKGTVQNLVDRAEKKLQLVVRKHPEDKNSDKEKFKVIEVQRVMFCE